MKLTLNIADLKPAVIGLGYVGLPLAVEMSKHYKVVGFDISKHRVEQLCNGLDATKEISQHELENAKDLILTVDLNELAPCNIYIVTVPTPIDNSKKPDLRPLLAASELIGGCLKKATSLYTSRPYIPEQPKRCAYPFWKIHRLLCSIRIFCWLFARKNKSW